MHVLGRLASADLRTSAVIGSVQYSTHYTTTTRTGQWSSRDDINPWAVAPWHQWHHLTQPYDPTAHGTMRVDRKTGVTLPQVRIMSVISSRTFRPPRQLDTSMVVQCETTAGIAVHYKINLSKWPIQDSRDHGLFCKILKSIFSWR